MSRAKTLALAAALVVGCLTAQARSYGGLWERWRSAPTPADGDVVQVQATSGGGGASSDGTAGAPGPSAGGGVGSGLQRTPYIPLSPGQAGGGGGLVPGTARGGAMGRPSRGNPPGTAAPQAVPAAPAPGAAPGPAASGCHDIVVEVPSGICSTKKICVHCRGCRPGRVIKVCGKLPECVTCQPRTFRVTNPLNGCPVDVTACLPDAPDKALRVDRDPYYITYHYPNARITIWFLFERNNDYIVQYAGEKPT